MPYYEIEKFWPIDCLLLLYPAGMLFTAWLSFLTIISQLPGGRQFPRKITFVTVKLSAVFYSSWL
ncbi:MAG: hypothetical protein CVU42_12150 [Chloroflexi bacterium HGW-Chloroflexi-4]|nr:MAG: hypothetical protein CVU42_12150 [Chloroflexi bacterium HGW-Chloroflexi-4]